MAKDMSASEAKDIIDDVDVVLDVRTPSEFDQGHIKNAINIDMMGDFQTDVSKLDKEKSIFIYCRSGSRSSYAIRIMEELGFDNIYHLEYGLLEWREEGLSL